MGESTVGGTEELVEVGASSHPETWKAARQRKADKRV
jgi:hypothetical protein